MVPWLRRKCLAALCKICSHHALIPGSIQIPLCYNQMEAPRCRGGFGEVWKGEHKGFEVAVKVLKICPTSDLIKIRKVDLEFGRSVCVDRSRRGSVRK